MDTIIDYSQLQRTLHYHFKDESLLQEALRHSSYVNEQTDASLRDNERLEFLGDAVLSLVIGDLLMRHYPQLREGDLSRIRANMVNETQLADIARSIDLGRCLMLGKGEVQTNGHDKNSILADAMEAVIAAIYLDNGFGAAFAIIEHHFKALIETAQELIAGQDYKSRLQEAVQSTIKEIPRYNVVEEIGPDHDKTFRIVMTVGNLETHGIGKSKKMAEQDAARKGLDMLEDQLPTHH